MEVLEGTQLKWAEIDFPTVQDELRAIDEYMVAEEIDADDCWPMFLRACAYESRGSSTLALAQLSKIVHKAGIAKVPNLWERRAYNAFKTGDIGRANAFIDVGMGLCYDALGNHLHFSHWFDEHFADYLPRHNGPAYAFQRGICKYCVGELQEAREAIVGGVVTNLLGAEHAVLWLIATAAMHSVDGTVTNVDWDVVTGWRVEHDRPAGSVLHACLELFTERAAGTDGTAADALEKVVAFAEGERGDDALTACIYLALYYDAIARDVELRDAWLDKVGTFEGGSKPTDTLDFVYHAAKYKFSSNNINTEE